MLVGLDVVERRRVDAMELYGISGSFVFQVGPGRGRPKLRLHFLLESWSIEAMVVDWHCFVCGKGIIALEKKFSAPYGVVHTIKRRPELDEIWGCCLLLSSFPCVGLYLAYVLIRA